MRHLARLTLVLLLAVPACGKKHREPIEVEVDDDEGDVVADPSSARTKLLAALKKQRSKDQQDAPDALAKLSETDKDVIPGVVELLKDKGHAGGGKAGTAPVTSTREGAVKALLKCGPDGEKALAGHAVTALRPGLTDPAAGVREHTAHTLGVLGPRAAPLAPEVLKLVGDPSDDVRAAAFDAVPAIGRPDPAVVAKLLRHDSPDVRKLAAQLLLRGGGKVPPEAVRPLSEALNDRDELVRSAAVEALAAAGPAAAPVVPALVKAIEQTFPKPRFDPDDPNLLRNLEAAERYAAALGRIGEPAAAPVAKLLASENPAVRLFAAYALVEIGPGAKAAAPALTAALADPVVNVRAEAAAALCRAGGDPAAAVKVLKELLEAPAGYAEPAIRAVGRAGPPAASLVPLALKQAESASPDARRAVAALAADLPPDQAAAAAPALVKLLADDDFPTRARAAAALEALGPKAAPAAAAVGAVLADETDAGAQETLVDVLAALGPAAKPAVPALLKVLAADSTPARLRAKVLPALAAADPNAPGVAAAVVKAAADPDEFTRAAAAKAIGRMDPLPPPALAALVAMAQKDRSAYNRVRAAKALAAAGPRAAPAAAEVEKLAASPFPGVALWGKVGKAAVAGKPADAGAEVRAALASRDPNVRAAAVEALPAVGPADPADLPAVVRLLKDPAPAVRAAAAGTAAGFAGKGREVVGPLAELLADRDSDVREAAAAALGNLGPAAKAVVPQLQRAAHDGSTGKAARAVLAKLGVKVNPRPDFDRGRDRDRGRE